MRSTINLTRAAIVTMVVMMFFLGTSISAFADVDAKFLHGVCRDGDAGNFPSQGYCMGVATGIFQMAGNLALVCPLSPTSYGVAMAVMKKYLADHPELGDEPAAVIALAAFMKTWPCPARQ